MDIPEKGSGCHATENKMASNIILFISGNNGILVLANGLLATATQQPTKAMGDSCVSWMCVMMHQLRS